MLINEGIQLLDEGIAEANRTRFGLSASLIGGSPQDYSRFWANVVITALHDENGDLRGFAKVTRDMTERRRSEEALRVAREEAIAAVANAISSLTGKRVRSLPYTA